MTLALEPCCPLLLRLEDGYPIPACRLQDELAWGDKVSAMKRAIAILVNGDSVFFRNLSVAIVRYVLPCEDRTLQKLVLLYLEIVSNDIDIYGRVPPDRTLICKQLRNNLEHCRNEHIRCDTLRFLCRVRRDVGLVEPLVASVLANLDHPHAFVRRDAFSAVYALYRLRKPDGSKLLPCAPADIVERALDGAEQDAAAIRNAFLIIFNYAQSRAAAHVLANADRVVSQWPDLLQFLVVHIARRYRFQTRYTDIVMSLISSPTTSDAVLYECADALLWISSGPTAVRAAANAFCKLLKSSALRNDNSVRLIVQDRLHRLCISHSDAMADLAIDTVASPSRNASVDAKMRLQNMRKVLHLKEEFVKTTQAGEQLEETGAQSLLVQAFLACVEEHHDVVAPLLMDSA